MARILVTGSAGFIGRALCPLLRDRGHRVTEAVRPPKGSGERADVMRVTPAGPASIIGEVTPRTDWSDVLDGIDIVIHLAQRAHRRPVRTADEPAAASVLARAAAASGVHRLVYVSSIKAMGDATPRGRPFRAGDPPRPGDAYGRAKLATEAALTTVAAETGLELVIVRPPLVYGPGVGGNFRALMRLIASGMPLPLAATDNRRSLIARDNLADLLAAASVHPAAAGRVLVAADGPALSTAELIRLLAAARGLPARLFPLPAGSFRLLRAIPGLAAAVSRLTLSLEIDDGETRALLGWAPPLAAERALAAAARDFAAE